MLTFGWQLTAKPSLSCPNLTAKRDSASAYEFNRDLSERVTEQFQITTDGLRGYAPAIEEYFGAGVDFAQLLKLYGTTDGEAPDWYGPRR
jgi:hypothetical protein